MNHRRIATIAFLLTIPLMAFTACLLLSRDQPFSVSAVSTQGQIGVYWDRACTKRVTSLSWGTLVPGNTKDIVVYVRNEGNDTCYTKLTSTNWNPSNAPTYLTFMWTADKTKITAGETTRVKQSLRVSPNTKGISNFSFNIIYTGTVSPPWDINQDGEVDILDIIAVTMAYGSRPGSQKWNPRADLNGNGIIDLTDVATVSLHYGEQYS